MSRKILAILIVVCLWGTTNTAQAQFGRLGPAGLRPPLPPFPPIPAPVFAGPGYVRVPGVGPVVPVAPGVVVRPSYGYVRPVVAVPVPVVVPVAPAYSAARVAVVQPVPPAQYRAGSASYPTPSTATPRVAPAQVPQASTSGDLRPGMVLPDGAIVLSVGQAGAGSASSSQPYSQPLNNQPSSTPSIAPQLAPPSADAPGTQSILEPAEELPAPQPSTPTSGATAGPRKF